LKFVRRVCEQIGAALREHHGAPAVVIRSTMLPGTMRDVVIPTLEASSGQRAGVDFGVCINPEFLREGTAVYDFFNPPKTVIGQFNQASGDLVASLYARIEARSSGPTSRPPKWSNTQTTPGMRSRWVSPMKLATSVGASGGQPSRDGHFLRGHQAQFVSYYLKPGFAFGGSCLPKDLRALLYKAKSLDVSLPILAAILRATSSRSSAECRR